MPIKLKDIAKIAGVSEATASLALNGSPLVKNQTREKVLAIAKENGYLPNAMAKGLAKKKSNTIGLVVPDIEDAYYSRLVRFVDEYVKQQGYNLILAISNDNPAQERSIVRNFIMERVEGIIIAPVNDVNPDVTYLKDLKKHRIPHVFVSSYYPDIEAPFVMVDLEEGSYQLTKHLLNTGHKDIYFLVGPEQKVLSSKYRIDGYKRAYRELGIKVKNQYIVGCEKYDYENAHKMTEKILNTAQSIDAIIAINDTMALGTINALKANGISIPKDISVAGYDDMFFSIISAVPITTVKQDIPEVSAKAVEVLVKMINKTPVENDQIFVAPTLVIRESTK